jgi:hypothetical protein
MKQNLKWFTGVLAVAGGLAVANSVSAQSVVNLSTINPSTLDVSPNALYPSWNAATITSQLTGLEVAATGYGSLYYVIPTPVTLNANDTLATLTLTINSYGGATGATASSIYIGLPFILGDNSGSTTLGGYSGPGNAGNDPGASWNGNVVTLTQELSSPEITAIQAGDDAIYTIGLETDPASAETDPYDITFNSLVLSPAATPEPAPMALAGMGAACLMFLRRRK